MINSKKQLAVTLSRLEKFERPSLKLEQYPTDSEIAAGIIWFAYQRGDIKGKLVADLGSGTGILGIGAMLFNPNKVYFVDKDERSMKKLQENLQLMDISVDYETFVTDINNFNEKVDVVIQNPPFGTKNKHADKKFLEKAFTIANIIYSFHKLSTEKFIGKIAEDNNFKITNKFEFDFPLKQTQFFHSRKIHRIKVGCWRLEKLL